MRIRPFGKSPALSPPERGIEAGDSLQDHVHVDRAGWAEAVDLIAVFGELAQMEAASRADRSRTLGNLVHFCRWRQIERAIVMLNAEGVAGSIH